MWIYIFLLIAGGITAASAFMFAKKDKKTQQWICTVIAAALITISAVCLISLAGTGASAQIAKEKALENTGWRKQHTYSSDYRLTDDLSICVSLLADRSGYAVYDTSDGSRIGTLLWEADNDLVGSWELKIQDSDSDGENEVGVITQSNSTIWYDYVPNNTYSTENIAGAFQIISLQ